MLVYFAKDGSLKEIVSSYRLNKEGRPPLEATFSSFRANRGNRSWNEILVHFEGGLPDPFSRPTVSYGLPDGTTFSPADTQSLAKEIFRVLPEEDRDLRFFKELEWYEFYRFPLPPGLFEQGGDGRYLATFRQHVSASETASFDLISFRVDRGVAVDESFINETQYEYLNALVHSFDGRVERVEDKTKWQSSDAKGTSFQGELRACSGTLKANEIGPCETEGLSFRLSAEETSSEKPLKVSEVRGSEMTGVSFRDATGAKEILKIKDGEVAFSQSFIAPAVKLSREAEDPSEAVSKGYVDAELDKTSADRLNLKNGEALGSIVMKSEGNSVSGNGAGSFVGGKNSSSASPHSIAFGEGISLSGSRPKAAFGKNNDENASNAVFAIGCGEDAEHRKNALEVHYDGSSNFLKVARFFESAEFSKDAYVNGNLFVRGKTFATDIENVSTSKKTIGLAKGNVAPITGYAGLYATKYDGENYGALAWDKDGVAYVGDCSVDEKTGEISDLPSNGLQPLLTRAKEGELSNGDVFVWDAGGKKATGRKIDFSEFATLSAENVFLARQSFPMGAQFGNTSVSGGRAMNVSLPSEDGEIATTGNSTQVIIRRW